MGDDDREAAAEDATSADDETSKGASFELRALLRQLTAPVVEQLDSRLREQVEAHLDSLLTEKVEAEVRDRLSVVDRALADLSRTVADLERRMVLLEEGDALDDAAIDEGA